MTGRLFIFLLFASAAVGQTDLARTDPPPSADMTFDVASVRQVRIEPGHSYVSEGIGFQPSSSSHFTMINYGLATILEQAFFVRYDQLVGYEKLPADLRYLLYTIQARCDEDTDKLLAKLPRAQRKAEQQHMFQALLIDRFQLKFHWESRLGTGYRLVVVKGRSKLSPAGSLPLDSDSLKSKNGDGEILTYHTRHDDFGGTEYVGRGASLKDIVQIIAGRMGAPVQDATGLRGKYDFDLRTLGRTAEDNPQENPQIWPPMIDAVRDQLGLRLESAQLPQEFLVIDQMAVPSPN